jgi:hypothetical protein
LSCSVLYFRPGDRNLLLTSFENHAYIFIKGESRDM